jgi:hypothetical protein
MFQELEIIGLMVIFIMEEFMRIKFLKLFEKVTIYNFNLKIGVEECESL